MHSDHTTLIPDHCCVSLSSSAPDKFAPAVESQEVGQMGDAKVDALIVGTALP